jgi:protoporphyrin/coproporphyrin ferrochelatase
VLVCPVGFVSDHLEIRWDIDVEAAELARELGVELARIEMPNDEPAFIAALAGIVRRTLGLEAPAAKPPTPGQEIGPPPATRGPA